jgi:hypothetical protein
VNCFTCRTSRQGSDTGSLEIASRNLAIKKSHPAGQLAPLPKNTQKSSAQNFVAPSFALVGNRDELSEEANAADGRE